MTPEELEDRIDSFHAWQYRFELPGGVTTPVPDGRLILRQQERRRYFFEPMLSLLGGSLRGRRVLDLGCGAGFWALEAVRSGAEHVHGVDHDETALQQARLVFEASDVDPARYEFERGDALEAQVGGRFDVVLCLGLLNHVAKPVVLFERIAAASPDLIVLESELVTTSGSVFELADSADGRRSAEHRLVLIPSRGAVHALAAELGFHSVALAPAMRDYTGLDDYRGGRRRAFVCARDPALLAGLQAERAASLRSRLAGAMPRGRGRSDCPSGGVGRQVEGLGRDTGRGRSG